MTNTDRRSTWTQEASDICKQYWIDGMSAQLIGARMGISRNAVIGRMHRLGLTKMGPRRANQLKPGRPRKPRLSSLTGLPAVNGHYAPLYPMPVPQVDDIARVAFEDLEPHHCRFIPHEPKDGYCGLERVPGSSYCAAHLHRCYVPVRVTGQMAAHDRVTGQDTVAATAQEFLEPA